MLTKKAQKVIQKCNLPKIILTHLFGKQHPLWYRVIAGLVMIFTAMYLSKSLAENTHSLVLSCAIDALGGLFHAAGAVPILEFFIITVEPEVGKELERKERIIEDELVGRKFNEISTCL